MSKYVHWAEFLAAYDFMLAYWLGEENLVPDALSHLPLVSSGPTLDDEYSNHLVRQLCPHDISLTDVQSVTGSDDILQTVNHFVKRSWPQKAKISANILPFFHIHSEVASCILQCDGRIVCQRSCSTKS